MKPFTSFIQQLFQKNEATLSITPQLHERRKSALAYFLSKELPAKKEENWRHKAIDQLTEDRYLFQTSPSQFRPIEYFFKCNIKNIDTQMFAFFNGWYVHQNEPLTVMENGVIIGSVIAAMQQYPELVWKYMFKIDLEKEDGTLALNEALFSDGIFIYIPENVHVKKPIQIVSVAEGNKNLMIQHRHLVVVDKNASLSFIHCDDSLGEEKSLINNVIEISLAENALLHYYKMENKDAASLLMNNATVSVAKNAQFYSHAITFNGGYIRNRLQVNLNAPQSLARLYGLYLVDKKQYVDNQVLVRHNAPNCSSSQLYKGIADEQAGANFSGHIIVQKNAQNTAAFQTNKNIALTNDAKITTHPFLEIYADDVKCSHGATIGQLDEDAMFYLRTRGICKRNARMLLMYAFAKEVANYVEIDLLRKRLNIMIKKRLSGELTICDQCVLHCSNEKAFVFDIETP